MTCLDVWIIGLEELLDSAKERYPKSILGDKNINNLILKIKRLIIKIKFLIILKLKS